MDLFSMQNHKAFSESKRELSRLGRFFCDNIPTSMCLVGLEYRPAIEHKDHGYFVEFMYKVANMMLVLGVNLGPDPLSDKELIEVIEVFRDKFRHMCAYDTHKVIHAQTIIVPESRMIIK